MTKAIVLFGIGVLSVLLAVGGRGLSESPPKDRGPNELPRAWSLEDIEKATPPYRAGGRVHVLAWKIQGDDRPLRVETCLVLKDLGEDDGHGQWHLAHLYRHPLGKDNTWRLPPDWISPPPPLGPEKPEVISYDKRLKKRPRNKDIYDSLGDVLWTFTLEKDWKLVGCAICERGWEAATGEKPTRFFGP